MSKRAGSIVSVLVAWIACCGPGATQSYPTKSVRFVVPFAAGGITDIVARLLGQRLTQHWRQQVIIDNRPGANAQLGAEAVLRAPPDGYTLLVSADTTFVMIPHLYHSLKYDPLSDFEPVSGLGYSPQVLVVHSSTPVKNVAELIAYGNAHPRELNYGTFGIGSSGHLNIELLQMMTGARFTPVHYRGAAPAISDLIGGHIQLMIVSVGLVAEMAQSEQLRLLAIGSESRLPQFPDTPTLAESGLKGFEQGSWYGLVAPKATPPEIISEISGVTQVIFGDKTFQRRSLAPSYIYSIASEPPAFADMMRRESAKWKNIIEQAGVKVD